MRLQYLICLALILANQTDPKSKVELESVVEEVKLLNMHEFHEHAMKSVGVAGPFQGHVCDQKVENFTFEWLLYRPTAVQHGVNMLSTNF